MKHYFNIYLKGLLLIIITFNSGYVYAQISNSKQVTIIERVSPAEILVEAQGIYHADDSGLFGGSNAKKFIREKGAKKAIEDAKKASVYHLLYNDTDAILNTAEKKEAFKSHQEDFFKISQINSFFAFEEQKFRKMIEFNDGKSIRIIKRFKVNTKAIRDKLIEKQILNSAQNLIEKVGNPFIAVLPVVNDGENPIQVLKRNSTLRHGVSVVESYLTSRRYDVIVPEQQQEISKIIDATQLVEGNQEDLSYKIALAIGSDIYITLSTTYEPADYGTQKAVTQIKAYETTTARLLGTETGYSRGRKRAESVSVEESVNDAIDRVLSRVNTYWENDLKDGIQYKLIVKIDPDFDSVEAEDISFVILDAVNLIANRSKQNIFTKQTLDMNLWCDHDEYNQSLSVYRNLRTDFNFSGAQLRRLNINRKLLQLEVVAR